MSAYQRCPIVRKFLAGFLWNRRSLRRRWSTAARQPVLGAFCESQLVPTPPSRQKLETHTSLQSLHQATSRYISRYITVMLTTHPGGADQRQRGTALLRASGTLRFAKHLGCAALRGPCNEPSRAGLRLRGFRRCRRCGFETSLPNMVCTATYRWAPWPKSRASTKGPGSEF